jgi:hypothetical protein
MTDLRTIFGNKSNDERVINIPGNLPYIKLKRSLHDKSRIKLVKKTLIIKEDDNPSSIERVNKLLEPYKENELLPVNILKTLLTSAFTSCEILHEYSSYHIIIKIKIEDLLSANITNWEYNRPADVTRCYDIARYIYGSKQIVDTMLYLSFNNKKQSFDVVDGIHRYTSLKLIKQQNQKQLDLITPSEFGNNNDATWLFDSYIPINVRLNASEGELIELFKSLNKSNPIPDLYIKDVKKEKRDIIEGVANNYCVKYKAHFSSNSKPNKPNINRDRFIDLLDKLYDKYKLSSESSVLLQEMLDRMNTEISYNVPIKLSQPIKDKCLTSGCWLFIYSVDEIEKRMTQYYKV